MITEARQAALSIDLDEREMIALLSVGGFASVAAFGVIIERIRRGMRRDRAILREWLDEPQEQNA